MHLYHVGLSPARLNRALCSQKPHFGRSRVDNMRTWQGVVARRLVRAGLPTARTRNSARIRALHAAGGSGASPLRLGAHLMPVMTACSASVIFTI